MNTKLIITTINDLNSLNKIYQAINKEIDIIAIGDKKTPIQKAGTYSFLTYLDIQKQKIAFPEFEKKLPQNHYSRKNIGYLKAIQENATLIIDWDDDIIPLSNFNKFVNLISANNIINSNIAKTDKKWFNVYSYFTEEKIWMRGYPLNKINENTHIKTELKKQTISIVQCLTNGEPDVDSIYRLVFNKNIEFNNQLHLTLPKNVWSPFNSQSTLFKENSFPLLYLPTTCGFRITDILRGFIAQRCLWANDENLIFSSPTNYQKRNKHNLMNDFSEEIDLFITTERISQILEECKLVANDNSNNLYKCYENLVRNKILKYNELSVVETWLKEINKLN